MSGLRFLTVHMIPGAEIRDNVFSVAIVYHMLNPHGVSYKVKCDAIISGQQMFHVIDGLSVVVPPIVDGNLAKYSKFLKGKVSWWKLGWIIQLAFFIL